MSITFTEKIKETTCYVNNKPTKIKYFYYEEYPDIIWVLGASDLFAIVDPENLDKYSETMLDAVHHARLQEFFNGIADHLCRIEISQYDNSKSIIMHNSSIWQKRIGSNTTLPGFDNVDNNAFTVVDDMVFGSTIHYMYIEKYSDIIFPLDEQGSILGFILIDAGMNMIGMAEDEILNLQKLKYVHYSLGNAQDCLYELPDGTFQSIINAIANNSTIYAEVNANIEFEELKENATLDFDNSAVSLEDVVTTAIENGDLIIDDKEIKTNNIPNFHQKEPTYSSEHLIDIDGHIYEKYIRAVVEKGIINTNENFKPDSNVTRGQLAVILCRVLDLIKK